MPKGLEDKIRMVEGSLFRNIALAGCFAFFGSQKGRDTVSEGRSSQCTQLAQPSPPKGVAHMSSPSPARDPTEPEHRPIPGPV